jgi:hypothetical protein
MGVGEDKEFPDTIRRAPVDGTLHDRGRVALGEAYRGRIERKRVQHDGAVIGGSRHACGHPQEAAGGGNTVPRLFGRRRWLYYCKEKY